MTKGPDTSRLALGDVIPACPPGTTLRLKLRTIPVTKLAGPLLTSLRR
jgi:hypothetical protein